MFSEDFYRNRAKTAWVGPLTAVIINTVSPASHAPEDWRVRAVMSIVCGALVLIGFFSGIIALIGAVRYRRVSIILPAIIGVSFNSLVIVTALIVVYSGTRPSTARATAQKQHDMAEGAEEMRQSITGYGSWIGTASTSIGGFAVMSVDDRSPTGRRFGHDLPVPCSVLMITARPTRADDTLEFDTSTLRMRFADGHAIKSLNSASILAQAKDDPQHVLQRLGSGLRPDQAQNAYGAVCLIPRGTDLRNLASVTFRVNSIPITIHGEFLSPDQVQARYGDMLKAHIKEMDGGGGSGVR